MHHITIDASPRQLSKLRNGHPVRIKHGEGFNLLIHPQNYRLVSRAFNNGKGVQIALSPEEIGANAQASAGQPVAIQNPQAPQSAPTPATITGTGIFGSYGDKMLNKVGMRDIAYKAGDYVKPLVKAGIGTALTAGGVALGVAAPELIPGIPFAVAGGTALASDFLDNPSRYTGATHVYGKSGAKGKPLNNSQSQSAEVQMTDHPQSYSGHSGAKGKKLSNLSQQSAEVQMTDQLNNALGTNMDYLRNANLQNAMSQQMQGELNASSAIARQSVPQVPITSYKIPPPQIIYGDGIHKHHHMRQHAIVGRGGGQLASSSYSSPALQSQPFGANFQFQHFLPPQYQSLVHGKGLF